MLHDGGQVDYRLGSKGGNGGGGSGGMAFDLREGEGGREVVAAWTVQGSAAPAPAETGYGGQGPGAGGMSQMDVGWQHQQPTNGGGYHIELRM